jgi:hypothetical protein
MDTAAATEGEQLVASVEIRDRHHIGQKSHAPVRARSHHAHGNRSRCEAIQAPGTPQGRSRGTY